MYIYIYIYIYMTGVSAGFRENANFLMRECGVTRFVSKQGLFQCHDYVSIYDDV